MSSSALSSYSPSYYSISSTPNATSYWQQQQDPLQDFIVDVLQNHSLPTYDEGNAKKKKKKSYKSLGK